MRNLLITAVAGSFMFLSLMVPVVQGQETVSVEEFRKLKTDYEELKREVRLLRQALENQVSITATPKDQLAIKDGLRDLKKEVKGLKPGLTNVLVSGYGFAGYTDAEDSISNFRVGFNPVLVWELNEQLLAEAELEFELEDGGTNTNLEYLHLTYIFNDYITFGAGKFLSPFGIFRERLHPKWINKFPDAPLGYASGAPRLAPPNQIGIQARGGIPLWNDSKMNYATWFSNGPSLLTGAANAGQLSFSNTNDNNNNKAYGFRFGYLPIPELELGYSLETSVVGSSGSAFSDVSALLQGIDASYIRNSQLVKGMIDIRSEWIFSEVDSADYGTGTGPFENDRWAGYAQISYRPTLLSGWISNVEPVVRFDVIEHPAGAPSNVDEKRWTFGVDYWLGPSTVVKFAYRSDSREEAVDQDAFLWETAMGF